MDKKKINWQPISIGATLLIAIMVAWININIKLATLETETRIKIIQLEKDVDQNATNYNLILKELQNIRILIENKADKK